MSKDKKIKDEAQEPVKVVGLNKVISGFGGILMTFVVVSIAYSTYVVYAGTVGRTPKIMLIPQALFAAALVVYKFVKS